MPTFYFCIDQKFTMWDRHSYQINAETREEAIEIMKKEFIEEGRKEEDRQEAWSVNNLEETYENMEPIENDGQATRELFIMDGREYDTMIMDNAIPPAQNSHV